MVSHPATGHLLRCTSLPFGYSRSPEIFCSVTEGVAKVFRRRVAGMGIHILCYVDDYLVFGDSRDQTQQGLAMLDALLFELGLAWAPHKMRGPCRVIEFLGLLIVNTVGRQCMALTSSRQSRLGTMVSEWMARRPETGRTTAGPRELAKLLGHLVFASEVVPGGRTYMQAMLRQFKGLRVDWLRGTVRSIHNESWGPVVLTEGFWRDLVWWASALLRANSYARNSQSDSVKPSVAAPKQGKVRSSGTVRNVCSSGRCARSIWRALHAAALLSPSSITGSELRWRSNSANVRLPWCAYAILISPFGSTCP